MSNYTPLRYPGGKGRFSNYVSEIIQLNDLQGGHYVEPFAGGAGVAFHLLFSEQVKHIHINDLDKNIYSFWYSVLNDTDRLCKLINDTDVTIENWLEQREIKRNPDRYGLLKRGFATFFLNRCNRSGIINAGVIGGLEQQGKWKIDARFNKAELIERIRRIAIFSKRITLTNLDITDYMSKEAKKLPDNTLIYFDPPYFVKGSYLYQNFFKEDDHKRLAKEISKIKKQKWIVSYDNAPEIKEIYSEYEQEEFTLSYSVKDHTQGTEVMIFQDGLLHPDNVYTKRKAG